MEALMASAIGVLTALGVYLVLRARTFAVIIGLMMLSYAVNLFLLSMGRLRGTAPPVIVEGVPASAYADPVPQALILTAIVIGFGTMAFALVLAHQVYRANLAADQEGLR